MEINAETKLKQVIYTDLFDDMLCLKLKESIEMICESLDWLKGKPYLSDAQQEDWDQFLEDLYCVEGAYVYYSGDDSYSHRLEEYEGEHENG